MGQSGNIVLLEPYYGGSHASFVDTVCAYSRHRCRAVTLPARKWKWRMRGAAMWFARHENGWLEPGDGRPVEVILANDMLSVADLRAMLPAKARSIPIVCYFHENQLTYPIPDESDRDYQYGMTNITSCLAADAVWFNSRYHFEAFLSAAERLLSKMPDCVPSGLTSEIRERAVVLPPPVDVEPIDRPAQRGGPVTILWPHRWEYDKNPEPFFAALLRLIDEEIPFQLVLVGEQFRTAPPVFESSWDRLRPHIVHVGYLPSREDYLATISRCDLVVSTAIQENFGIAVVEAILAGCRPLLPNRLAYPEIVPAEFHMSVLYESDEELLGRLRAVVMGTDELPAGCLERLRAHMAGRYSAKYAVESIDRGLDAAFLPKNEENG